MKITEGFFLHKMRVSTHQLKGSPGFQLFELSAIKEF